MTEAEWLAGTEPTQTIQCLNGRTRDRKLRLFAAACTQMDWDHLDRHSRRLLDLAEQLAEGQVNLDELTTTLEAARRSGLLGWLSGKERPGRRPANREETVCLSVTPDDKMKLNRGLAIAASAALHAIAVTRLGPQPQAPSPERGALSA
jgi:hypothetical protein